MSGLFRVRVAVFIAVLCAFSPCYAHQFTALLVTQTAGHHHKSTPSGVDALLHLSRKHNFKLVWNNNVNKVFTAKYLASIDVIIFFNTSGDLLNDEQKAAFKSFIGAGKGFVGIHSASATEENWEWYGKLVGRYFYVHPKIQTARLSVHNTNFPGLERAPKTFWWTDEWYEFGPELSPKLNYLLTVEESTYSAKATARGGTRKGEGMGEFHPVAWYHFFEGGRSFYTSLGHTAELYDDAFLRNHIYGGIYWAATARGLQKP